MVYDDGGGLVVIYPEEGKMTEAVRNLLEQVSLTSGGRAMEAIGIICSVVGAGTIAFVLTSLIVKVDGGGRA